jgi:hypothetical protein
MLINLATLEGIAAGNIDLAFRRWTYARVKPGTRLRTRIGVLEVQAVEVVTVRRLTAEDARRAGFATRAELIAVLKGRRGAIHRVTLRYAGDDPRVALREDDHLDDATLAELRERLDHFDAVSRHGPWTRAVLRCIAERPSVHAADLAASFGREKLSFKRDVRKLKELGLTESLRPGYRLSPRGRSVLERLD